MKPVLSFTMSVVAFLVSLTILADEHPCTNTLNIQIPAHCQSIQVNNPLSGVENFRPLQQPPQSVLRIKPNTLYRSANLNQLTEEDKAWLDAKGVKTVVDFRSFDESATKPDQTFDAQNFRVDLPIGIDPTDPEETYGHDVLEVLKKLIKMKHDTAVSRVLQLSGVNLETLRVKRYQDFARDFSVQTARFMKLLIDPKNLPLIFHCEGGKDRTGFHAAVVMLTLGFSREDAINDYLTTNLYTFNKLKGEMQGLPSYLNFLYAAHRAEISAALDVIQSRYPDFNDYLQQELGLSSQDVQAIRDNLLQPRDVERVML